MMATECVDPLRRDFGNPKTRGVGRGQRPWSAPRALSGRVAVRALSGIFESGLPASVASLRLDEGVARAGSIGATDAGAARARPRRRMDLTNMGAASHSAGAVRARLKGSSGDTRLTDFVIGLIV